MIQIKFKNLEKSELAKEVVMERLDAILSKFKQLEQSRIVVTLEMENSPVQAGPDLFTLKFHCRSGKFKELFMQRSAPNLYKALADLSDGLLERLNRFGDKRRVKRIKRARRERVRLHDVEGRESA